MEIKTIRKIILDNYDYFCIDEEKPDSEIIFMNDKCCDTKYVKVDDLIKRIHSIMNVRNNEKDMRLMIIDLHQELDKN